MFSTFCLALVVYVEARGEPLDGQLLVAEVVINRSEAEGYPDTICEVAFDPDQFTGLTELPDMYKVFHDPAWETSVQVADEAMSGNTLDLGATHYHNNQKKPYWAKEMVLLGKYGRHTFYREEK